MGDGWKRAIAAARATRKAPDRPLPAPAEGPETVADDWEVLASYLRGDDSSPTWRLCARQAFQRLRSLSSPPPEGATRAGVETDPDLAILRAVADEHARGFTASGLFIPDEIPAKLHAIADEVIHLRATLSQSASRVEELEQTVANKEADYLDACEHSYANDMRAQAAEARADLLASRVETAEREREKIREAMYLDEEAETIICKHLRAVLSDPPSP